MPRKVTEEHILFDKYIQLWLIESTICSLSHHEPEKPGATALAVAWTLERQGMSEALVKHRFTQLYEEGTIEAPDGYPKQMVWVGPPP